MSIQQKPARTHMRFLSSKGSHTLDLPSTAGEVSSAPQTNNPTETSKPGIIGGWGGMCSFRSRFRKTWLGFKQSRLFIFSYFETKIMICVL